MQTLPRVLPRRSVFQGTLIIASRAAEGKQNIREWPQGQDARVGANRHVLLFSISFLDDGSRTGL